MEIVVEPLAGVPVARQGVEYVERKGLGHPDSICDAMMEAVSVALSEAYLDRCGRVLHHNIAAFTTRLISLPDGVASGVGWPSKAR